MSDEAPRSAYEIAMERLRMKDAESGTEAKPRTDEQRAEIAEVRSLFESRIAQAEVMHASRVAQVDDAAARRALDDEYVRERQRLVEERDVRIERIRAGR